MKKAKGLEMERRFVSVSLPLDLIKKIDKFVGRAGYCSRPDVIRDAIELFIKTKRRLR